MKIHGGKRKLLTSATSNQDTRMLFLYRQCTQVCYELAFLCKILVLLKRDHSQFRSGSQQPLGARQCFAS